MAEARLRVLLSEAEIAARVEKLAEELSQVDDGWTVVALLQGAIPFTADLMRAFERRGRHPIYDSLWLESYRDERESSGKVVVRADVSRAIEGRPVLILDDVFAELDTGRRERLAERVAAAEQVLVTAAVPDDVPPTLDGARYDVMDGEVRRVR